MMQNLNLNQVAAISGGHGPAKEEVYTISDKELGDNLMVVGAALYIIGACLNGAISKIMPLPIIELPKLPVDPARPIIYI